MPPTFNLAFKRIKDEIPPDGAKIIFVRTESFYGTFEVCVGVVEYCYNEIDEQGRATGNSFWVEAGEEPPPPDVAQRIIVAANWTLTDNTLWARIEDVDALLDAAEAKED